ncbi:hypothetical protein AX17_004751 [Amanita inopinata Kibby_2008]|nr:hypothetical protein AX17_004751 [Amanita inopinata Kibby_2008]
MHSATIITSVFLLISGVTASASYTNSQRQIQDHSQGPTLEPICNERERHSIKSALWCQSTGGTGFMLAGMCYPPGSAVKMFGGEKRGDCYWSTPPMSKYLVSK